MEFKFKEVKELPIQRRGKHKRLIREFLASKIPIADITEYLPKNKTGSSNASPVVHAIRKLNVCHLVFTTNRSKRSYIVNIQLTGLRRSNSHGGKKDKLKILTNERFKGKKNERNINSAPKQAL